MIDLAMLPADPKQQRMDEVEPLFDELESSHPPARCCGKPRLRGRQCDCLTTGWFVPTDEAPAYLAQSLAGTHAVGVLKSALA